MKREGKERRRRAMRKDKGSEGETKGKGVNRR